MTEGGNIFLAPGEVIQTLGVTPGMVVGHLGCGSSGFFAVPLARIVGNEGKVYALDVQQSALQGTMTHARLDGVEDIVQTVWSDLEMYGAAQIPAGSLDIGLLINVLFQVKDISAVLKESARLVKPGGKIAVIDWRKCLGVFGPAKGKCIDPHHVISLAAPLGLTLESRMDLGAYHFELVFVKK